MAVPSARRCRSDRALPEPRPSDYALTRTLLGYAIALHCGGVATAAVAAAIDDGAGVSRGWQAVVLGALVVWAAFFTLTAVQWGLTLPLVVCDTVLVALLLLAQPRIVPVSAVVDETTWAIMLAGTTVYVALFGTGQVVGLVLSSVIIVAYVEGAPEQTSQVRALVVQAVAVSAIMWLLRRGGRRADAVVADRDRERRNALVEAVRRADERHHRAQMHDSVLATLTMVASGAVPGDSPILRRDALRAIEVMEMFSGGPLDGDGSPVDLLTSLCDVLVDLRPQVVVDLVVTCDPESDGVEVPQDIAAAITGAVGEALRNVARHSGVKRASVRAGRHAGVVTVTVTDRGSGFDPDAVPSGRQGIRSSIVERMTLVGGNATVTSRPGAGTTITLRWPRG